MSEDAEKEKQQLHALVEQHVAALSEHFDSVRIFTTLYRPETSETSSFDAGSGNFMAQLGQINEWILIQQQFQRNWAIRKDKQDSNEQ